MDLRIEKELSGVSHDLWALLKTDSLFDLGFFVLESGITPPNFRCIPGGGS